MVASGDKVAATRLKALRARIKPARKTLYEAARAGAEEARHDTPGERQARFEASLDTVLDRLSRRGYYDQPASRPEIETLADILERAGIGRRRSGRRRSNPDRAVKLRLILKDPDHWLRSNPGTSSLSLREGYAALILAEAIARGEDMEKFHTVEIPSGPMVTITPEILQAALEIAQERTPVADREPAKKPARKTRKRKNPDEVGE